MSVSHPNPIWLYLLLLAFLPGCDGNGGTVPGATTGTISGTVSANGSGVAGAELNLSPGGSATTSSTGQYRFENLQPRDYTLAITPPAGFRLPDGEAASRAVSVTAGSTTAANWSLAEEGSDPDPSGDVVEVRLTTADRFSPEEVTISPGTTVRWINDSNMLHTVTPDNPGQDGVWSAVSTSSQGVVLEHTFTVADETYDYHCEPHRGVGMVGRITVQ